MLSALASTMERAHRALVEDDARDLLIYREERIRDTTGGFEERKYYVGVIRGRVYIDTDTRQPRTSIEPQGSQDSEMSWGLAAYETMKAVDPATGLETGVIVPTDLRAGRDVVDSFELEGVRYEIAQVRALRDGGRRWGVSCSLEAKP